VYYQSQVDDWKNCQELDARMTFGITPTRGETQVGAITAQLQSTALSVRSKE